MSLELSDLWSQTLFSEKHLEDFNLSVTIASDLLECVSLLPIPSEKKRVYVENVNVTFIVSPPPEKTLFAGQPLGLKARENAGREKQATILNVVQLFSILFFESEVK